MLGSPVQPKLGLNGLSEDDQEGKGRLFRFMATANPRGYQLWIFTGKTDADDEAPILWPTDVKSQLIEKDPDAGKVWGQEDKGAAEDEVVGWNHQFNEHESHQSLEYSEGHGSLVCCNPWGHKESDMT